MNMANASRLLALALVTFTLAATAPTAAQACGSYVTTPEMQEALKLENSERQRLATLRATRADRCVAGSIAKVSDEEREEMSDLPWEARQRRSVAIHYPRFSEDDYGLSFYMTGVTLNLFGFEWNHLNSPSRFEVEYLALRPAGSGEWMVVQDFKSECPQAEDSNRFGMQQLESI